MKEVNAAQFLILLILLTVALTSCLPAANSEETLLLEQDYLRMTDPELVAHEQALGDAMLSANRSGAGDVNVGIGLGSWGGSTAYGIHADRWLGGGGPGENTLALKARRDQVRAEMRRRGLLPQQR